MTVLELAMTTAIMGVVLALLFQALSVFSSNASSTQSKTYTVDNLRLATETVLKDLRAANPISPLTPVSRFDTEVSFTVYCSTPGVRACASNRSRATTYRVTNYELTRTVGGITTVLLGPSATSSTPRAQRAGAVVNSPQRPVFRFFDVAGTQLVTTGGTTTAPTRFRDCSRTVRVALDVVGATGKANVVTFESTVDLRNFQEVSAC